MLDQYARLEQNGTERLVGYVEAVVVAYITVSIAQSCRSMTGILPRPGSRRP